MYPGFFKEIATLDKKRDASIKVAPVTSFAFAENETVLPALLDELPALVREYPVVFTNHEVPVMVALLGHEHNNYIDEGGNWRDGVYVPLTVRTYPFAGLDDAEGNSVFCIDRTYAGIGSKGGEKVFADKEGTLTPFGLNAANFVNLYVANLKKSFEFVKKLKELDLFLPANITVTKEGQQYSFSGLNQINFQKLSSLSHDDLKSMIDSQELYYIYLHQFSLNNFTRIV
jgi:hypothetical protein